MIALLDWLGPGSPNGICLIYDEVNGEKEAERERHDQMFKCAANVRANDADNSKPERE
jgi:hypothetical protein